MCKVVAPESRAIFFVVVIFTLNDLLFFNSQRSECEWFVLNWLLALLANTEIFITI